MTPPNRRSSAAHPDIELGAYVIAALTRDEEMVLEAHLGGCPQCQDRLVELTAALPALQQVSPAAALALVERPGFDGARDQETASGPGVLRHSGSRRRAASPGRPASRAPSGWRVGAAVGGVAAAAAAAVLVAVAVGGDDGGSRFAQSGVSASQSTVQAAAVLDRTFPYTGDDKVSVKVWNAPGGASITVHCHNNRTPPATRDPDPRMYALWVMRDDGREYKVSSWPSVYGDDWFEGRVDFDAARISSLELRDDDGKVLSTSVVR